MAKEKYNDNGKDTQIPSSFKFINIVKNKIINFASKECCSSALIFSKILDPAALPEYGLATLPLIM